MPNLIITCLNGIKYSRGRFRDGYAPRQLVKSIISLNNHNDPEVMTNAIETLTVLVNGGINNL